MKLIEEMLTIPEREIGGTTALDRFDYQTAWGLAKVMALHSRNANYAVAFEFHDDIVELDNFDDPKKAVFYQVKTRKSGNWTFKRILDRETSKDKKSKKPSFAGKMFDNAKRFGDAADKLVFVSNQACSELGDDYKDFAFVSAAKEKVEEFKAAMKEEDSSFHDGYVRLFYFSYSDLNLGSYHRALMQDVSDFVQEQLGIEEANTKAFGYMLVEECRKRSKKLADLTDFEALKRSKFVTRSDMNSWLAILRDKYARRADWASVAPYISDHITARDLRSDWDKYDVERRRRFGASALKFQSQVRRIAAVHINAGRSLLEGIDAALPEVREISDQWQPRLSDRYLRAIILYEHWHAE